MIQILTTGRLLSPCRRPDIALGLAAINKVFYLISGRTGKFGFTTSMYPSKLNEQYTPIDYGTNEPSASPTQSPELQQLEQFPVTWIAAAVPAAVISIILLTYFKKRHR
jgi:hypothetical protein